MEKNKNLPKSKEEIEELLMELEKAYKKFGKREVGKVIYCMDCKKIVIFSFKKEPSRKDFSHCKHFHIYSWCEHDGIGEWIRCLRWVLGKKLED